MGKKATLSIETIVLVLIKKIKNSFVTNTTFLAR